MDECVYINSFSLLCAFMRFCGFRILWDGIALSFLVPAKQHMCSEWGDYCGGALCFTPGYPQKPHDSFFLQTCRRQRRGLNWLHNRCRIGDSQTEQIMLAA